MSVSEITVGRQKHALLCRAFITNNDNNRSYDRSQKGVGETFVQLLMSTIILQTKTDTVNIFPCLGVFEFFYFLSKRMRTKFTIWIKLFVHFFGHFIVRLQSVFFKVRIPVLKPLTSFFYLLPKRRKVLIEQVSLKSQLQPGSGFSRALSLTAGDGRGQSSAPRAPDQHHSHSTIAHSTICTE